MPFDEGDPFEGEDGAPTLKPNAAALFRFANGHIKPGGDGDPPTDFYGSVDYVKNTDFDDGTIDLNTKISQHAERVLFIFRGPISAGLGDLPDNIMDYKRCLFAWMTAKISPTSGPCTVNFEYMGDPVLTVDMSIPQDAPAGSVAYGTDFALDTLDPDGFALFRPLVARCILPGGAAQVTAGLALRRYFP